MHRAFAQTANVKAFMAAVARANKRGAPEAGITLVTSEPGYGKSRTVKWWGEKHGAIYIRAKASWTPHWFLSDLAAELSVEGHRHTEQLFAQVIGALMKRGGPPLIVDEIEHCLRDAKVIEQVRDVTDLVECPVVFVGMESVPQKLNRLPQIVSRIAATVTFGPATEACVRAVVDTVCEVKVGDDLVAEIHRQSAGRLREILNAIAVVEALGKRAGGGKVSLADIGAGVSLVNEQLLRRERTTRAEPAARAAA